MDSTGINSILLNLKYLDSISGKHENEVQILKLDLRFLRTFLLCSAKYLKTSARSMSIAHALAQIEEISKWRQVSGEDEHKTLSSHAVKLVSDSREIISSIKDEIREAYACLSVWFSRGNALSSDELVEITESVLENVSDLKCSRPLDQAFFMVRDHDKVLVDFLEAIDKKLSFCKCFICYVMWCGVDVDKLESLLARFQVMVVNGARATCLSWFDRFDKFILIMVELGEIRPTDPRVKENNTLVFELLERIKLDDLEFQEMYVQLLGSAMLPSSLSQLFPLDVLADFVDSLHAHVFELLRVVGSSERDEVNVINEGLRFLSRFLKSQESGYKELGFDAKDLIHVVVNDAGILVCSIFVSKMRGLSYEGILHHLILDLQKKIEVMMATVEPRTVAALKIGPSKYHREIEKAVKTSTDVLPQVRDLIMNEVFVGLHEEINKLVELLPRDPKQLKTITISGMPGLGKTTFAKRVYNDPSIKFRFPMRAWCCVSQLYSAKDVLFDLLSCIDHGLSKKFSAMDENDLAQNLFQLLKGNKYLIVLDDVWSIEAWNALALSFPEDNVGSRILLTSRLSLQINANDQVVPLRQLSDEESWELLKRKLFSKEEHPELSDIGRQIAKNCNGLPLLLVIVAGILATVKHDSWGEIASILKTDMVVGEEKVKSMLELSYVHLTNSLQKCFLYFGAFPEDREIPVWKLRCLWIAEGFVDTDHSREGLEDIAEDHIKDLIGRSLVMVGRTSSTGGAKTCQVHDLLHMFCVMKAKEESCLNVLRGSPELLNFNNSDSMERLSIHSQVNDFSESRIYCPRIPSLLFFPIGYVPQMCNISFIFNICKLLRVLDLEQIVIGNTFPGEIELLDKLRYLAIHGDIKFIPSSIANLKNLETFRVKVFYLEALLPATIWSLKNLRHLVGLCKLDDSNMSEHNLEDSPSLDCLETLDTLTASDGPALDSALRKFPNIRKLKCRILETGISTEDHERMVKMDFWDRLQSLKLFLGPSVVKILFPDNLKKLTLDYFSWSIVSRIGKLRNLEVLKLHNAFGEVSWKMEDDEFPKLEILKLGFLNMVGWMGCEDGENLPCLKKLVLEKMWNLSELPEFLEDSSTLEMIELRWCHQPSIQSVVWGIGEAQKDNGNEDFKIIILGGN